MTFDQVRQVLRLALELRELPRGSVVQKRHALDGLTRLVGAQVALWVDVAGTGLARPEVELGWSGDAERAAFLAYVERDQWTSLDPTMAPFARVARAGACTVTREQLLDDRGWYGSDHVQGLRRAADVDHCLYSTHEGSTAAFSLHRPWGGRAFTERERRLVELFHQECGFLHAAPSDLPPAMLRDLPPRLRDTLRGLARGQSEKQLAAELGLSPHTIHDYVKALHRHFGVQSRGELLARCLASD